MDGWGDGDERGGEEENASIPRPPVAVDSDEGTNAAREDAPSDDDGPGGTTFSFVEALAGPE